MILNNEEFRVAKLEELKEMLISTDFSDDIKELIKENQIFIYKKNKIALGLTGYIIDNNFPIVFLLKPTKNSYQKCIDNRINTLEKIKLELNKLGYKRVAVPNNLREDTNIFIKKSDFITLPTKIEPLRQDIKVW